MYQPLAHITAADADNEPSADRLFAEPAPAAVPALPMDLTRRGWKLIERAPSRMFAVSSAWGCTATHAGLRDVVREARAMIRFCEWANKQEQRDQDTSRS